MEGNHRRSFWLATLASVVALNGSALATASPALDCLIEPDVVIDVGSPVTGVIESIAVDRSDVIEKGQALVQLQAAVEKASVALARARAKMDGEIKAKRANYDYGKRKHARIDELFSKKAVPFHQKDEAQTEAILAGLELRQAKESKRLAELELQRAVETLNQRTVRSPIDGVVVERLMAPGEYVEKEPILKIAKIDPLRVEVIVPAALFGSIEKGMRARVRPESPVAGVYSAEVTIVDKVMDASSGTFGVRLQLPNPEHKLPAGLKCKVRFLKKGKMKGVKTADKDT